MAGGRPPEGKQQRRSWLEEIASWFQAGLNSRDISRRAFAHSHGLDYKVLCRLAAAERLPTEETMRLVAHAFGCAWSDFEPMWHRAKQGERQAEWAKYTQHTTPLRSWDERPALTGELEDLLDAQCEATEALPYGLLGVHQPTLTEVYVRQSVRRSIADRSQESMEDRERNSIVRAKSHADQSIRERTLSVTEALNGNQHLLITGEPGAGKSTLGYVYVQRLSRYWLEGQATQAPVDEPVLPLRIPARALARPDAWSELLAAGASEALGRLLATRPRPELFSQKNLGARWLVFVDGLDEIVSSATRDPSWTINI
jgi:hypothetical protein